jgi:hypothetical protein
MAPGRDRVHDRAILDALEAAPSEAFEGIVWRTARKGRDPVRGSSVPGRWSPLGEFDVLYTSVEREGALAEIGYRLSLEPVWPSRIEHELHRIEVRTQRTLRFIDVASLVPFGVDPSRYQSFDYSATQSVASAAHFLQFDGLIVPSARFPCLNLVIFLDQLLPEAHLRLRASEPVDWADWRRTSQVSSSRPKADPQPMANPGARPLRTRAAVRGCGDQGAAAQSRRGLRRPASSLHSNRSSQRSLRLATART